LIETNTLLLNQTGKLLLTQSTGTLRYGQIKNCMVYKCDSLPDDTSILQWNSYVAQTAKYSRSERLKWQIVFPTARCETPAPVNGTDMHHSNQPQSAAEALTVNQRHVGLDSTTASISQTMSKFKILKSKFCSSF